MPEAEPNVVAAIVYFAVGILGAVAAFFLTEPVLSSHLQNMNEAMARAIAKTIPPYISGLIALLGVDFAIGELALSRGWIMLSKLVIVGIMVVLVIRMLKKLRKTAKDVRK